MTIASKDLNRVLQALSSVLPFAKQLDDLALAAYWVSFPAQAKADLTPAMLAYAMTQRLMDPAPPKEVPLHLSLLRYVYRLENGQPNFAWGLKEDLPQRMANGGVFHAAQISQAEQTAIQGREDHDTVGPNGVLAQIGWQP